MAVTNTTIDMTWTAATDNVGVVSYHIYQSTDNVVYTEIHSTDGVTYAYTAIGLSEDTKYYFKQTAKDAAGNESLYGNTVEATTLGEVGYTYLLDDYPGAVVAYSLRKLRTGEVNAVEVRRDNDNATTNVLLYDDPSKPIDLLSTVEAGGNLGDWVGGNSAYVRTWYDQSGNDRDASSDVLTEHPIIINAGTFYTQNGLPAVYDPQDIGAKLLWIGTPFPVTGDITIDAFNVATQLSSGTSHQYNGVFAGVAASDRRTISFISNDSATLKSVRFVGGNVIYNSNATGQMLINTNYQGGGGAFDTRINSSSLPVNSFSNDGLNIQSDSAISLFFGNSATGTTYTKPVVVASESYIQEVIYYFSDQSSNRTGIETAINNHYNVFVVTAEVDAQLIQADTDNVSDSVIEINGVRSSASDTAVANLISRNNTVITK